MEYQWKKAAQLGSLDAQKVGEQLESIRLERGHLTPEMVLRAAKSRRSPLHGGFTWDDGEAAQAWRLNEARYLLRMVVMIREDAPDKEPIRAFVVVRDDEGEWEYTSTVAAMSNAVLRQQVLARALKELEAWRDRYDELEELAGVFAAIDQMNEAA